MADSPAAESTPRPLVLASASPRRRELLGRLGLVPEVVPTDVDESVRGDEVAVEYVARLANVKAAAGARVRPGSIVVAADTAVVLDGEILGKPEDRDDALRMLTRLSGRTHEVLTAVAVFGSDGSLRSDVRSAAVRMAAGPPDELAWYVDTGEPMDKAGAYAVQGVGAFLIERVEGDPTTVIGLPLRATLDLLVASGLSWPGGRPAPDGGRS